MKIVLDLKTECLSKDDVIVFDGKNWVNIPKEILLKPLSDEIKNTSNKLERLTSEVEDFKCKVNERLENYHKVIQLSVEEEEE